MKKLTILLACLALYGCSMSYHSGFEKGKEVSNTELIASVEKALQNDPKVTGHGGLLLGQPHGKVVAINKDTCEVIDLNNP